MKTLILAAFSFTFFSYSLANAENSWKLEKDKDGIKVWTRKAPNTALKEYRATEVLNTSVAKLVEIFRNTSNHDKWMYKCQEGSVKVVKKNSENDFITYMIMSLPLIKSRDAVTHFTISPPDAKGAVTISVQAEPNLVPLKSDYIRIPKMKGYWKFSPIGKGQVEVVHQALSAPGGILPDNIANLGVVDAPYTMMEKLKEMAQ